MIELCLKLLSRRPVTRPGAQLAAWLLVEFRNYAEADSMLERALAKFPDDAILLTLHAQIAQRTGRPSEAVARWRRRLAVDDTTARPWWGLAKNLRALGRYAEATEITREALRRFPDDPRIIEEAAFAADHRADCAGAVVLWRRLLTRRKVSPIWWQQYTGNLIRLGQLDEAERMIGRAKRSFPDHVGLHVNTGLLAAAREDWTTAVRILAAYQARHPDDPAARNLLGRVLQLRSQAAIDTPTAAATVIDVGRAEDEATRALLLGFESLGRDCEFGMVQRRFGAEPLGLLRWNATTITGLLLGLACRFEGLGDPAHLRLQVMPYDREYFVFDPRYDFEMHTFIFEGQTDGDALFRKMCRTVDYLRDKLLGDLASARKVFVYSDPDCEPDVVATLHAALRRFGPVRLLWVVPAEASAPPYRAGGRAGEIYQIGEDLFVGVLSRLGIVDHTWNILFDEWVAMCRRVESLTQSIEACELPDGGQAESSVG